MTDTRYKIDKGEFYITNVCNLNCDQCNRFNDYNFRGWQRWSEYADQYSRWSKLVDIKQIVILGGEPLLNPSILDWIQGLNQLWGRPVQILTNGTRLNHVPGLYEALLWPDADPKHVKNWIGISVHNHSDLDYFIGLARKFLKGSISECRDKNKVDKWGNSYTYGADMSLLDENGVMVCLSIQDSFYNAAVQKTPNGQLKLYNNDPQEAHDNCGFVMWKNYHFIRGNLYKCGPAALFPEFDQQHSLTMSDEDRALINNYRPFTVDQIEQQGVDILKNIDLVIPQCKFCPVPADMRQRQIFASLKKHTIPISLIDAQKQAEDTA
jgi:Radical SAM superfamily/4Fe-4S single cluster domain